MILDITEAKEEVQNETESDIEAKTAIKWAQRSCACFELAFEASDEMQTLSWLFRANLYEHEMIEHGSFIEDDGKLLDELKRETMASKMRALGVI